LCQNGDILYLGVVFPSGKRKIIKCLKSIILGHLALAQDFQMEQKQIIVNNIVLGALAPY